MRRLPTALEQLEIAAPCAASWDAMRGGAQRRHCARCDREVVNVAGFTRWEAEQLLLAFRERHCLRIARLEDGTVVTDGLLPAARRRRGLVRSLTRAAAGLVVGLGLATLVWRARLAERVSWPPPPEYDADAPGGDRLFGSCQGGVVYFTYSQEDAWVPPGARIEGGVGR